MVDLFNVEQPLMGNELLLKMSGTEDPGKEFFMEFKGIVQRWSTWLSSTGSYNMYHIEQLCITMTSHF